MEKKKIVHQLDTPYSTARWPEIAADDQETSLELLCTLLAPIGEHRSRHMPHSKGKRDKKRKRETTEGNERVTSPVAPPPPELISHIDVGLVAVTRRLQESTRRHGVQGAETSPSPSAANKNSRKAPAAVFVARAAQPSILNSHFPQLIAVASQARPDQEPIRLFGFSKACEARLSEALGIPRASCISLDDDAPGAKTILDYVRKSVSPITLDWLTVAQSGEYKPTKIKHIPTTIGVRKQVKKT